MATVAFDVDLNRIHGYSDRDGRLCYNAHEWPFGAMMTHDLILVEVASPVCTAKVKSEAYNRRKWAIGNSMQVGRLMFAAAQWNFLVRILVSPADRWTLGHPEKVRDVITGCAGEDNHDIRACRAMLKYHFTNPDRWVPLSTYYDSLSVKKTGKVR